MIPGKSEWAVWVAVGVGFTVAFVRWSGTMHTAPASAATLSAAVAEAVLVSGDTLQSAAGILVARDPFRLERKPSAVAYRLDVETRWSPPSSPAKPSLELAGILGGPPWQAVLLGLPGRKGSLVVRAGESVEGFAVVRVGRDTVVVRGADTTWILTVRGPWH